MPEPLIEVPLNLVLPPPLAAKTPPPAGTVTPGNLYVETASLTLWLGVSTTVDPDGAKLISDIDGTLTLISETLSDANAYTNQQVNTRAPTVHTHTSSQITDFTAAVQNVANAMPQLNYVPGMLMMWAGAVTSIGVGDLADWILCDGRSLLRANYPKLYSKIGTLHGAVDSTHFNIPDLRERFVMGAGTRAVGAKVAAGAVAETNDAGSHIHTINNTALGPTQIPGHTHPMDFNETVTGTTGKGTNHYHGIAYNNVGANPGSVPCLHYSNFTTRPVSTTFIDGEASHTHPFSANFQLNGNTKIQAGTIGQPHTHTMAGGGGIHKHTTNTAELREAVPFYALCYIIKGD